MTKDEMIKKYVCDSSYENIQEHIKKAMLDHKDHIFVGKEGYREFKSDWICSDLALEKLEQDGFIIESAGDYNDEWRISW